MFADKPMVSDVETMYMCKLSRTKKQVLTNESSSQGARLNAAEGPIRKMEKKKANFHTRLGHL